MPVAFKETAVAVGGAQIQLLVGGSGEPLLILHGAGGSEGPLHYAQALAERYTVYLPSHPGFGGSQRPDWLETIHDLAAFYNWFLESQDLYGCRAIGFSLGGWLAAEMVAAAGPVFRKLLLVGAVGIKPQQGEIADVFIISPQQVIDLLFHDPAQSPEYQQLFGQPPPPELAAIWNAIGKWRRGFAGNPICTTRACRPCWPGSTSPPASSGAGRMHWPRWNAAIFSNKPSPALTW